MPETLRDDSPLLVLRVGGATLVLSDHEFRRLLGRDPELWVRALKRGKRLVRMRTEPNEPNRTNRTERTEPWEKGDPVANQPTNPNQPTLQKPSGKGAGGPCLQEPRAVPGNGLLGLAKRHGMGGWHFPLPRDSRSRPGGTWWVAGGAVQADFRPRPFRGTVAGCCNGATQHATQKEACDGGSA